MAGMGSDAEINFHVAVTGPNFGLSSGTALSVTVCLRVKDTETDSSDLP